MQSTEAKKCEKSALNEISEDEEFDPHFNRQIVHPNTSLETLLHIVKGCFGTGILAMPEAFKYSGLVNGIILTVFIGVFNSYCFHILVGTQYLLCRREKVGLLTYPESLEAAIAKGPNIFRRFSPYSSYLINTLLLSYQIGACSVYILFVGENMKLVINTYLSYKISLTNYMLISFVPFCFISCVRNLKILASVSLLGNIICLVTYGVIGYYAAQDLESIDNVNLFGELKNYPLFFGTAMFSLQAIGVMTTAENNMAKPKDFRRPFGVLNIGIATIAIIYIFVAGIGFWRYGNNIKSSITLNFPTNDPLGQSIRVLYSLAIFVSYSINLFVIIQIFWKALFQEKLKNATYIKILCWDYLHRLAWVVLTFVIAIGVPFLGLVISFLGNFNVSLLLIIIPAFMEICVFWPNNLGRYNIILWKNLVVILFGALAFCAGTFSALYEMSRSYSGKK